jgi:hypothetical protein
MIKYYICIKKSRGVYYHCIQGKKTKSEAPKSMYYSPYIRHKFIFFAQNTMEIITSPQTLLYERNT